VVIDDATFVAPPSCKKKASVSAGKLASVAVVDVHDTTQG